MKAVGITILLLVTSCAQMAQKAKIAMNKGKYEKQLPYKIGDIVEFEVDAPSVREHKFQPRSNKKVSRFGLSGYSNIIVTKVNYPDFNGHKPHFGYRGDKIKFKGKILTVDKECKPYIRPQTLIPDRCTDSFLDKVEFISWDKSTLVKVIQYVAQKDQERLREQKRIKTQRARDKKFSDSINPQIQRKKHPKEAKACDKKLQEFSELEKRVRKPALTTSKIQKIIKSNRRLIEKISACAGSFLYNESDSYKQAAIVNCLQYASVGAVSMCN